MFCDLDTISRGIRSRNYSTGQMGRQESHKGKNATASGTALVDLLQVLL